MRLCTALLTLGLAFGWMSGAAMAQRTFHVSQLHPASSDNSEGSADVPWATLARAMVEGQLHAGDTLVVHAGTYREAIRPLAGGSALSRLVIRADEPGTVIVSGADVLPASWFHEEDGLWILEGVKPLTARTDRKGGYLDVLFVNGVRYEQLEPSARLLPGMYAFQVRESRNVLVIMPPDSLRGHLPDAVLERSRRAYLFAPHAPTGVDPCMWDDGPGSFDVSGIIFEKAANDLQQGAVCAGSRNSVFADIEVRNTASVGMFVGGSNHEVRHSRFLSNGQSGLNGRCTSCRIVANASTGNNWKHVSPLWEAGGGKWTKTFDTLFLAHRATDNEGPGLWLDETNAGNVIDSAYVSGNLLAGVLLELGTTNTIVRNSTVRATRRFEWSGAGILVQAAADNTIEHNLVEYNDGAGIWLRSDDRDRDGGSSIRFNTLRNNVLQPGNDFSEISIVADVTDEFVSVTLSDNSFLGTGAPWFFFRVRDVDVRWSGSDETMFETIKQQLGPETGQ